MAAPRAKPRSKPRPRPRPATSVREEIARFEAVAQDWWDAGGAFAPLHRLNPVRIAFIRDAARARFGRAKSARPLAGLDILDVGCGGGLLCEPMARLGARVTGIDAGRDSIRVATTHARGGNLKIAYRAATPEALVREKARFDVVLNMEVIEHVADANAFIGACAALVRPGGIMVLATLNRTLKSLLLAKVAAEYVFRWIPPGTHDWRKFVPPDDLAAMLAQAGMATTDIAGVVFDPWRGEWKLDARDTAINYMMVATRRSRANQPSRRSRAQPLRRGRAQPLRRGSPGRRKTSMPSSSSRRASSAVVSP